MALRTTKTSLMLAMKVWDRSTRLFHWLTLACMVTSYVSISLADGANAAVWMRVHVVSGETMLGLLIYRLIWGVIGSETARFGSFLRNPVVALRSLAKWRETSGDVEVGHNPPGGWMVVLLLGLLLAQVGTGLFANDDGATKGPLMRFVSKSTSDMLSDLHGAIFNVLMGAAAVHVVAITLYLVVKHQNLITPMVTGKKRLPAAMPAPRLASPLAAIGTLLVAVVVTLAVALL